MKRRIAALRLVGIGWYIAICIVLGVWGGLWLGNRFDNKVLFILLGLGLGLMAAFFGVYRLLLPVMGEGRSKDKENG